VKFKKTFNTLFYPAKTKTFVFLAVALLLTSCLLLTGTVMAQITSQPTYGFLSVEPNSIGVGQTTLAVFWMADPPPMGGIVTAYSYNGVTVDIMKPDGTNQTMGPYTLNSLGSGYFSYTPTAAGTYQFQLIYPGNTFADLNLEFLPSRSNVVTLVVQQDPVTPMPQTPLPTTYWNRPINAMNYEWSQVSGNWLMAGWNSTARASEFDCGSAFCPEGTSPASAHILWTTPLATGGLVGGQMGNIAYYQGISYQQYFQPPVIINGRLYYNSIVAQEPTLNPFSGQALGSNIESIICLDMRTGEKVLTIPNATLGIGQIYNYVTENQAGAYAYLWDTATRATEGIWTMYDPYTGSKILDVSNVPSGNAGTVIAQSSDGSILVYTLDYNLTGNGDYQLSLWNSSKAVPNGGPTGATVLSLHGQTIDGTAGHEWTVTEPNTAEGLTLNPTWCQGAWFAGNYILAESIPNGGVNGFFDYWDVTSKAPIYVAAYDMATGQFAWNSTILPPEGMLNNFGNSGEGQYEFDGIYYCWQKQTMQWIAWDVQTGEQLWISEPYTNPWGHYVQSGGVMSAFDMFYAAGMDGEIHAYDTQTGTKVFAFEAAPSGLETPYGVYPFYNGITVTGDGKIFAQTGQHGNGVEPMYRGQALYVVDAKTGQSLWDMTGWFGQGALADGMYVAPNFYDGQIYCFGRGPSATAVEAPLTAVLTGSSMVIQGTVTDQSPGSKGAPAISDQYMSEWMSYQYEQQALPSTFPYETAGVQVTITATSQSGNPVTIGTVNSDSNGNFAIQWTPQTQGFYTITASFAGSNSYYKSSAETHVAVDAASSSAASASISPLPSQVPQPSSGAATTTTLAIAAAIIIILIAAVALVLRRRK
jgi:hypothetical protein